MIRKLLRLIFGLVTILSIHETQVAALAGVRVSDGELALKQKYSPLTKNSLLAALHDPDRDVRVLAAIRLADAGEKEAVPFILALFAAEPTPSVRVALALEAARLGSEEGLATLRGTCRDGPSPVLRMSAAQALLRFLHNEDCLDDVVDVLRAPYNGRSGESEAIVTALTILPQFRHVPAQALAEIRRLVPAFLKSDNLVVRADASDVLGKLGDASSAEDLRTALAVEQDDAPRKAMISALKSLETKQAKQEEEK